MFYIYWIISAIAVLTIDRMHALFTKPYGWWLSILLLIAFFIGLVLLHLVILIISALFVRLDSPADRGSRYFRFFAKTTAPLLLKLARVHVHTQGVDQVPTDQKLFFVCNHQHDFDPVIIYSIFPDHEIGFIGKKEICQTLPLIARIMHKLHCLFIDRENDRAAAKTIVEASHLLKSGKASIALFPEGYTNQHCDEVLLLPFRNGAFKAATRAEAPIVVCVINNTRSIVKRMFRHKTDIDFRVLDVIDAQQYKGMNTAELGSKIHAQMEEELKKIQSR